MAKFTIQGTGKDISLTKNSFITRGGEGDIYIVGNVVYKITTDKHMIPFGKIQELAKLKSANIIVPDEVLLKKDVPYGYTMKAVPNGSSSLAKILPKGYREREGVTPQHITKLVEKMTNEINYIHGQGHYLQVDGNELNYMVTKDYGDVYFIDVNSYQTPSYPADAIMASIRDYSVKRKNGKWAWSQLSDAWSFAVISFYMFTAMHPFKGRHPSINSKQLMVDNMTAHKSVLDPQTQFPTGPIYHPFEDYIPGGKNGVFWQWYTSLFINKQRLPIPTGFQGQINTILQPQIRHVTSGKSLKITELAKYPSKILGYYNNYGKEIIVTKDSIYHDNITKKPYDKIRIGFNFGTTIAKVAWLHDQYLYTYNLRTYSEQKQNIIGSALMSFDGRLYLQNANQICELQYVTGDNVVLKPLVDIMTHATTMYNGVVIQNVFGKKLVSVFPQSGQHRQLKIEELSDYKVLDAKYHSKVLMVSAIHRESGRYDRLVVRFSEDWQSYDVRIIEDVLNPSINFVVTDRNVCVCINEEDKIELFSNKMGSPDVKIIEDPNIKQDMYLCNSTTKVKFAMGNQLYGLEMK